MSGTDSAKNLTTIVDQHGHKADVFPDGSLRVSIVSVAPGVVQNIFGEANAVPADVLTPILTMVSVDVELSKIEVDSDNVSTFSIWVDKGSGFEKIAEKGTGFGSALNTVFDFSTGSKTGVRLPAGQILQVRGKHSRPTPGRYSARILAVVL